MSFRDVFTDLAASSNDFSAVGIPEGSSAHSGMIVGCDQILAQLADGNLLERITNEYPDYSLILTGHSLGAGVVCLLGARLRSKYPDLKVYAFATPAGLLSREAARVTEQFVFTVGVGDDFVMRLSVDSSENLRVKMMETLKACKLPKVS